MVPTEQRFGRAWFLPGPDRGKYPHCHSLYLEGKERRVLVDPGADREALQALRDGPGVDEVWLSHYHEDHLTHLDLFEDRPLRMAAVEVPFLESLEAFFAAYGLEDHELRVAWQPLLESMFHFRPRTAAGDLIDGAVESLGDLDVEVLATPGHTVGHLGFLVRQEQLLFLGDYDLTPFGPWYGDAVSSIPDTVRSVERLRRVEARRWVACHEHGLFLEPPGERWDAFLAVIDQREEALMRAIERPRTLEELLEERIVYRKPREPRLFYDWAELAILRKHLERGLAEERVTLDEGRYQRR